MMSKCLFICAKAPLYLGTNKSLPQKKSSEKSVDDYIRAICLTSKVPWLFNDGRLTDMEGRGVEKGSIPIQLILCSKHSTHSTLSSIGLLPEEEDAFCTLFPFLSSWKMLWSLFGRAEGIDRTANERRLLRRERLFYSAKPCGVA